MHNYKNYISEKDKEYIKFYCKKQMEYKDLIRVKSLACLLEDKYALYEIVRYIKQDLKISKNKIFHGEADYISVLPRGHIQLVNDVHYNNIYLHQYVVCKELDLNIKQVQKYIIHHQNMQKSDNSILNLWIFYDTACHIAYHQAIKNNSSINIKQFTMDYIESIITDKNSTKIKDYLEVLDKLINKKMLIYANR